MGRMVRTMGLFRGPAEHAANPPSTWQIVHVGDRRWDVVSLGGDVIDSATTRRGAFHIIAADSWLVRLYRQEGDWYAGVTPRGWRPFKAGA